MRRIEYRGAGLTEWWASCEEGFQQGWTVAVKPEGTGALTLELVVEGAQVTVGDGELWLQGEAGGAVMVSELGAWDADGVALAARFERAEEGFRVRVEDEGARYPVEIDPVYTTAAWTAAVASSDEYSGVSVSGAGDVNGDGYDDVIVGARGYSSYTGRAYVYAGSASGVSTSASTTLTGEASFDVFGASVSGAGDVNGDGYDDVIVGAEGYSSGAGRVYVFVGSVGGVLSTASTTLAGRATDVAFGASVSGAGDVNGDGFDDVIVGAPQDSVNDIGRAYVYAGSAGGVSTKASTTLTGQAVANYFGVSVSGAGDVNGDGYDDVIVGAYGQWHGGDPGRAYVYAGSAGGLSGSARTTLVAEVSGDSFGGSVSGAGDVNGDGYDDVIVGARRASSDTGRAYVYAGSAGGVSSTGATTLNGEAADNFFGGSVSGAGMSTATVTTT